MNVTAQALLVTSFFRATTNVDHEVISSAMRAALRLASAGAASGAVGVGAYARYDEGTARSVTFWYHAFPVWAQYRAVQWRNRDLAKIGVPSWTGLTLGDADADAAYERLHERHALKVRDLVFDMRGFYFKNAQLLSTRDDFVPRQYLEWCKLTQDQAPAEMAPGQAEAIARAKLAETGHPDAFEWWEEEPCGVASIGQVHRARLARRYGGKDVVVKVQAPGIERKFRSDIRTCIDFCRLAMPQHVPPLEEIEKQFLTEFDYREEAKNLEEVRRNVMPRWSKKVEIPAPVRQLCTREVLVMDAIPGVKLVDGIRARFGELAASRGVDPEELERVQKEKIAGGELQPRSARAEAAATRRANLALRLGDRLWRRPIAFLTGAPYVPSPSLVNVGEVIQTMLDVHADEIFNHGVFNGDPHPGNILLMPDGRLGLIDYGQVKRVNKGARVAYAKLTLAILAEDKAEVARLLRSAPPEGFGGESRDNDVDVAYRLCVFWNDRDTPDVTGGLNLQEFIDEMEARDPVRVAPLEMVMIARVSVLLRGVANAFNVRLRVARAWAGYAEDLVRREDPSYYLLAGPRGNERRAARGGER